MTGDDQDFKNVLTTGYTELDYLLGGLQRSHFYIIAARTGRGKSTLAMNIATNAARDKISISLVSLQLLHGMQTLNELASEAEVDTHRLRIGLYTEAEEQRIINSIGALSQRPYFISDPAEMTVEEIHDKARALADSPEGLDLLIIDSLRQLERYDQSKRKICAYIKQMARDLKIPIIVCAPIPEPKYNLPRQVPGLMDLDQSVEGYADAIMLIHLPDQDYTEDDWDQAFPSEPYPRGMADIIVAKNLDGVTGTTRLHFRKNIARFDAQNPETGEN